jgi:transcriptional regulator with XRE-family HTH domain
MLYESDSTESLLSRTKKLLEQRGELSLREIAEGAGVGHQWVRSILYTKDPNPTIKPLEQLYAYLVELHAAKRFEKRSEARPS